MAYGTDNSKAGKMRFVLIAILILLPFFLLIYDSMNGRFPFTRYKGYAVYTIESLEESPVLIHLRNGNTIRAVFTADVVELNAVEIRYKSTGNNKGSININVYDNENGNRVGSWVQDLSELHGEQIVSYPFEYQGYKGSRQKKDYTLEIVGTDQFNRVSAALKKDNDSNTVINEIRSEAGLQFAVSGVTDTIPIPLTRFWIQMYFMIILSVVIYNYESLFRLSGRNGSLYE